MLQRQHHVFRTSADAELATPNAHARTDVVLGIALAEWTEGILVDGIGYPGDRPHLPVVGMTAELEVDAVLLSLFQMVRLMVEEDSELLALLLVRNHGQTSVSLSLPDNLGD